MKIYKCPKCNANLKGKEDKLVCEYCKSKFAGDNYIKDIDVDYIIPFEISKKYAKKIYNSKTKSMLIPDKFKDVKLNKKLKGIYLPVYIYNLDCTGELEFESSKISSWKSSGKKYIKKDIYKLIRSGNLSIKNMPVLLTSQVSNIKRIEPYNYNKLVKFNNNYLEDYKVYLPDKTDKEMVNSITNKAKEIFIKKVKQTIKNYDEVTASDNYINLYNSSKQYALVPVWLLNIEYNKKKYIFMINGQTGKFSGMFPINKKKIIYTGIISFVTIFFILLVLNILKVIL